MLYDYDNPKEPKIDKLYIHCDHPRRGYGAMLMAEAIKIMRENNLQSLMLTVNEQNHTAISVYRKYGFEVAGESIIDIGSECTMDDYLITRINKI